MVKKGFTLSEALIVMAIMSIFFAFAAKTVTTKPRPKRETNIHGYYECVNNNGWKERYVIENNVTAAKDIEGSCIFQLRPGIGLFWIQAKVGENYYNITEPNVNQNLRITFNSGRLNINGTTIEPNEGMEEENLINHLRATYSDSMLCNDNNCENPLNGIIISW